MRLFGRRGRDVAPGAVQTQDPGLLDGVVRAIEDVDRAAGPVGGRVARAVAWSWAQTNGPGIGEPPAPDAALLWSAAGEPGGASGREALEALVAADHDLCRTGAGTISDREAVRVRLLPLPPVPVDAGAVAWSYPLREQVLRQVRAEAAELARVSGRRLDVDRLEQSVRWWPGRTVDRGWHARADPLDVHGTFRALEAGGPGSDGSWHEPLRRLGGLVSGEDVPSVDPQAWVRDAFARRPQAVAGLGVDAP